MRHSLRRTATGLSVAALATLSVVGAAACVASPTTHATAQSSDGSGTTSRTYAVGPDPYGIHVFAEDSFWYRRLPANAPLDSNWRGIAADMRAQTNDGKTVMINTTAWSAPIFVTHETDRLGTVQWRDCFGYGEPVPGMREQWQNLRLPANLSASAGEDREAVIYNADENRYTEFIGLQKDANGTWSSCGGGSIDHARSNPGIFPSPFGSAASGLPYGPGQILPQELQHGYISHVVGIALPYAAPGVTSWPAWRTDGRNPKGLNVPRQGQLLRLPADLNIDALHLHPVARTIAKAAQEYGLVVWDTAGAASFRAQNPASLPSNPYPALYGGDGYTPLVGRADRGEQPFPWDKLQAVQVNYGK